MSAVPTVPSVPDVPGARRGPTALAARVRPALRRLPDVRAVLAGVLAGVGGNLGGLSAMDATIVGIAVAAVGLVVLSLEGGEAYVWPTDDLGQTDGTRREISSLTWSFVGRDGRVSENAVKHLQQVATVRLARRGVAVPGGLRGLPRALERADEAATAHRSDGTPDPAAVAWARDLHAAAARAEELLGARAWRTLGRSGHLPSLADVAHCVDVLEDLATAPPARQTDTAPPARQTDTAPPARPSSAPEPSPESTP